MDFKDSLKNIKSQMQKEQVNIKKNSKENIKNDKCSPLTKNVSDECFEEIFLKEQRLLDEFSRFIENSDIKKI